MVVTVRFRRLESTPETACKALKTLRRAQTRSTGHELPIRVALVVVFLQRRLWPYVAKFVRPETAALLPVFHLFFTQ
jgi:hypothetical protein